MPVLRVAVVTSDVPFVEGGHLTIARSTVHALRKYGYEADLVLTPQNPFGKQLQAYMATRLTDIREDGLGRKIDRVISFRFPSYAVKHPFHICWLNHRMREYYDLWEELRSQLGFKGKIKETFRRKVFHQIDTYLLKHNVRHLFAQSITIQGRLKKWGNIPSSLLYPPPPPRNYFTDSYQPFVFTVSRLQKLKRIHLLVEAFRHMKNQNLKAFIIGRGPEESHLADIIKAYNLEKRILLLGETDEKTVLEHYARCLCVYFAPLREDYGFVTGEAFASRKSVLTTTDSGGPSELVQNGQTGYIVPAQPKAIAAKLDELVENRALAEKMGNQAYSFISTFSWENTVRTLLIHDKIPQ
ncbi:MAG: glycosyltransferase family 4 protein [Candidatus Aminicenantes bacterium]|nr:glycosyltransferase family 4 protein [Candidatus Aminicenantes bacterium]